MTKTPHQKSLLSMGPAGYMAALRIRLVADSNLVSDQEMIELIIFTSLPKLVVKPTAKALVEKFGSFVKIINSSPNELRAIHRINDAAIVALKSVLWAAHRLAASNLERGTKIDDWRGLSNFLLVRLSKESLEHFVVFYLDSKNRLLTYEADIRGFPTNVPVNVQKIIRTSLLLDAVAVIMAHNHPSGDVAPSEKDREMTAYIEMAFEPIKLRLLDHIIVGNGICFSFKDGGLLAPNNLCTNSSPSKLKTTSETCRSSNKPPPRVTPSRIMSGKGNAETTEHTA